MKSAPEASSRQRIIVASVDLFAARGFAGTSMRQIAEAVGMRASSLYNHFPGKEAIFSEIIETYGPASSASWLTSPAYKALKAEPATFMKTFAADLLDQWCDPREQKFMELLSLERSRLTGERAHFNETWFEREAGAMADYFRGFALGGTIRVADPRETSRLFVAGLTLIRMEHFLTRPEPSPRDTVRQALDRFLANFIDLITPKA